MRLNRSTLQTLIGIFTSTETGVLRGSGRTHSMLKNVQNACEDSSDPCIVIFNTQNQATNIGLYSFLKMSEGSAVREQDSIALYTAKSGHKTYVYFLSLTSSWLKQKNPSNRRFLDHSVYTLKILNGLCELEQEIAELEGRPIAKASQFKGE